MLLVYFAGHGLIDPADGALILALPECEPHVPHEAGIPYEWIRRSVMSSAARRRVVILDCCYAGRAAPEMAAPATAAGAVADRSEIEGSALLVSASRNSPAGAPPGEAYTSFTGVLLEVLRNGLPGQGARLRVGRRASPDRVAQQATGLKARHLETKPHRVGARWNGASLSNHVLFHWNPASGQTSIGAPFLQHRDSGDYRCDGE